MDKWVLERFDSTMDFPSREKLARVIWSIWKARNTFIFQSRKLDSSSIVDAALAMKKNFVRWNLGTVKQVKGRANPPGQRTPLERGSLKLNIDE